MSENKQTSNKIPNFIFRSWNWFTVHHPALKDIGEQRLATLASSFTLAIFLLLAAGTIASTATNNLSEALVSFGFSLGSTFLAYLFTRTKYFQIGVFVFSLSFAFNAYLTIYSEGSAAAPGLTVFLYVPLSLIVAGAFLNSWTIWLLTGLNVGAFYFIVSTSGLPEPRGFGGLEGVITAIGILLIFLNNFRTRIEEARLSEVREANLQLETLSNELEQRVQERTIDLEQRSKELVLRSDELLAANVKVERNARKFATVSNIAGQISSISNLKALLPNVAEQISLQFGFYHVGIFLLDERKQQAILSATNSPGGKRMLDRSHRLKVGEEGIVGYVTGSGKPRIALDVGADAIHFNNPDLPETRSEMAVPLQVGGQIIGALDIQDKNENAFTEDDIEVITTLADLVSIAIENTRIFEDSQEALTEAQAISRQYSMQEWREMTKKLGIAGLQYSQMGSDILDKPITAPIISKAIEIGDVQIESNPQQGATMAVPIKLRDQVIGVLNISSPAKTQWDDDEIDIARAVAERVAISAENARLFEETTRRAERERMVSDITSKIRSTNDPQAMLQTALSELQKALGGAQIQIKPIEKPVLKSQKDTGK